MKRQFVYFIESGEGGPIKIGVATDIPARLRGLQAGNPVTLRLVVSVVGGHDLERDLHRQFASERIHGEWYRGDGVVRVFALSLITNAAEALEETKRAKAGRIASKRSGLKQRLRRYSADEWRQIFTTGQADGVGPEEAAAAVAERWRRAGGLPGQMPQRLAPGVFGLIDKEQRAG